MLIYRSIALCHRCVQHYNPTSDLTADLAGGGCLCLVAPGVVFVYIDMGVLMHIHPTRASRRARHFGKLGSALSWRCVFI